MGLSRDGPYGWDSLLSIQTVMHSGRGGLRAAPFGGWEQGEAPPGV
jgi:hypothetical protein